MRLMFWIGALLLPVSFVATAPQRPQLPPLEDKSGIEGIVLRAGTDEPVFKAVVRLVPLGRATPPATNAVSVATTDTRGRFVFTALDPGEYRLLFAVNSYVAQEYGQRVFPGRGTPLKLSAGQPLNNMIVRLMPTGTVSGRVLDRSGQPVGNVPVQLMRQKYVYKGAGFVEKELQQEHDTRTNDRGEYRLFFVTPGRYLLAAGEPPNPGIPFLNGPAGNRFREDVAFTFYPGVLDAGSAQTLNVRSGEERAGADLIVSPPHTYSVRGRVIDALTGAPPATVNLSLVTRSEQTRSRASYAAATGVFQFRDVPEGRYTAVAGTVAPPVFTGREEPTPSAQSVGFAFVNVAGADIDGIVLTLQTGVSVDGRVRVDGGAANTNTADLTRFIVQLVPSGGTPSGTNQMRLLPRTNVEAGGAFRLDRVWDTEYRLSVLALPEGWYVKQAHLGSQDVLNIPLRISTAPQDVLDILVSPNTAEIQVTAVDGNLKPVSGAQVVLVPTATRERLDLFNHGSADSNGHVKLSGVVPGDYRLIAWEAIEMYSWFDPEVLKEADGSGKELRVAEGSRASVEIRVIPAP